MDMKLLALTLREEHRLRGFVNSMLRNRQTSKAEGNRRLRKLHVEIHDL
jgi:hypothetical protein